MKTFKDLAGREWSLSINGTSAEKLRDTIQVDVMGALDGTLSTKILADPFLLIKIIYCLCQTQAEKLGITREGFGEAIGGQAIDDATTALLEEICGFFRQSQRTALKATLAKVREAEEISLTRALTRLSQLDVPNLIGMEEAKENQRRAAAQTTGGGDSTSLPVSAESIPGPSPSASS